MTERATDTFAYPCLECGKTRYVDAGSQRDHTHQHEPSYPSAWWAGYEHHTAHLAAILADAETVEAVAEALGRIYFEQLHADMGNIDEAYARAAIAVISARIGAQA